MLVIYVGLMGLLTDYAHVFRPVQTSASIGWSTSPYEYEVGMADLTVGVLGIVCLWLRGNFWLAPAIANAVWLLGDAVGHIRQMVLNSNHAANNSDIFLITEITMPFCHSFTGDLRTYEAPRRLDPGQFLEFGTAHRPRTETEKVAQPLFGKRPILTIFFVSTSEF